MPPEIPPSYSSFPPALDAVPPEEQLAETFPMTPGALAVGGVLALAGSLIGLAARYGL